MPCQIFDSTVDESAALELENFRHAPIDWPHLLLRIGPKRPNHVAQYVMDSESEIVHLPLFLTVRDVEITNVIDLRLPITQDWFCIHFMTLEREAVWRNPSPYVMPVHYNHGDVISFRHLLPVLLSTEIGGSHPFLQGVGAWLRSHGASALIYPSARSDSITLTQQDPKQSLVDWGGWNLVSYVDSEPTNWDVHFGHTATWQPWLPPSYELFHRGDESRDGIRGWKYEGVSSWNSRRFARSLQLAAAEALPGLSDFLSGLFSLLDVSPADYNSAMDTVRDPGTS